MLVQILWRYCAYVQGYITVREILAHEYSSRTRANLVCQASPGDRDLDLTFCTALRSIEVSVLSLIYGWNVFPTVTSLAFSEIVVIFSESEADRPSGSFDFILRELYGIREFTVAFCLEAYETFRVESQRKLTLETERAVAAGAYDFLPRPPLVFSRTFRGYVRRPLT